MKKNPAKDFRPWQGKHGEVDVNRWHPNYLPQPPHFFFTPTAGSENNRPTFCHNVGGAGSVAIWIINAR